MDRSGEVEQLLVEFITRMKAADTAGLAELFAPGAATLMVGSEPADWYSGSDATVAHLVRRLSATAVFRSSQARRWRGGLGR